MPSSMKKTTRTKRTSRPKKRVGVAKRSKAVRKGSKKGSRKGSRKGKRVGTRRVKSKK